MNNNSLVPTISSFKDEYAWLSNFYPVVIVNPDLIEHDEPSSYPSVEHYYVAKKTFNKADRTKIAAMPFAGQAKRYGRRIELRKDWEDVKLGVMWTALKQKFDKNNPELRQKLLATSGFRLVEGNDHGDKYWGVCNKTGEGMNVLGNMLEKLRKVIEMEEIGNAQHS